MTYNQQAAQPSVQDRSTQFVPVEGGTETTSAGAFLIAAYAMMWLCVLVFVFFTWRKTRAAQAQIEKLESALSKLPEAN
jgi:hypothetical protein